MTIDDEIRRAQAGLGALRDRARQIEGLLHEIGPEGASNCKHLADPMSASVDIHEARIALEAAVAALSSTVVTKLCDVYAKSRRG